MGTISRGPGVSLIHGGDFGVGARGISNPPRGISAIEVEFRFFTNLKSASSQHYTFPAAVLIGDYKEEVSVVFYGELIICIGNASNTNNMVEVNPNGSIDWKVADLSVIVSAPAGSVPLNQPTDIVVERIGSAGTIKVNGATVFSGTVITSTCTVSSIGESGGVLFSDGIISNVIITDAGTVVRDYPIDEDWVSNLILNDSSVSAQNGLAVNITSDDARLLPTVG